MAGLPEFRHLPRLGFPIIRRERCLETQDRNLRGACPRWVLPRATSAQAQVYVEPPPWSTPTPPADVRSRGLPPSEVLMIVRASGLRPLTQPARRGPHYVLLASDNMGGQLRVVVNANNGRIINAAPAYDPRFAYQPVRPRGLIPMPPPQQGAAPPPRTARHRTPN